MKPRIAVLQNSMEGPGAFAGPLRERCRLTFSRADRGRPLPSVAEFDGLLVLGGPASVYRSSPQIVGQLDLIAEVLNRGIPFLGICLGSQLLAKAAGARVYAAERPEFGVSTVRLTEAATSDALFRAGPEGGTLSVFQWHGDTFDLPEDAVLLAEGKVCRHQAFRVGRAWGVQFHVEVTVAEFQRWLRGPERAGYHREILRHRLDRSALIDGLAAAEAEQRAFAERLIDAFLAEIQRS